MLIDFAPEIVEVPAAVAGYGDVFIHEGRTLVVLVHSVRDLVLQRDRIARTDDVFRIVLRRISAVHPETGGIVFLAFFDHFGNVGALAALVAGAPEQHAGMVAVAKDHLAHPLLIHGDEIRNGRHIFRRVGLVAGLVDNIQAILVREVQVLVDGRVVGRTHCVEIELLEDLHVLTDSGLVHRMAQFGMLHVGALGDHLERLSVDDFGFLEADAFCDLVHDAAGRIMKRHGEVVEVGRFRRPLLRGSDAGAQGDSFAPARGDGDGILLHPGNLFSVTGDLGGQTVPGNSCVIRLQVDGQAQVGVRKSFIKVRDDLPVADAGLRRGKDGDVVKDAGEAPVILAFQIVAVAVLQDQHGHGIAAWFDIWCDIVFRGLLRALVVAHFLPVDPDERGGGHLFEADEDPVAIPGGREIEGGPVGAGRIIIHRHVRYGHAERCGRGCRSHLRSPHRHVLHGRRHHVRLEGRADVAEERLSVAHHFPVGRHLDEGPFPVVETRAEETVRNPGRILAIEEFPFPVQRNVLVRNMEGSSFLLVESIHGQVLNIVRKILHEGLVLRREQCRQQKRQEDADTFH